MLPAISETIQKHLLEGIRERNLETTMKQTVRQTFRYKTLLV